ncbi:DUF3343 domain-containing protein [Clostridium sp. MSJ-11]|uniref:DUF3343 domain-containing protein n=1 Tax=Clostridium mobile TaxID=2841512 RepID=A0ABS6EG19_9CLOT|nr:DUF3343 domain-containing protein [Clostridium mobile]MBU5483656.1 DUF3343 domain-containing protein [Clostridium mobile]
MYYNIKEYILVCASYNIAIFLHNKLLRQGHSSQLISTPCRISSGCSQAVKFKEDSLEYVKELIAAQPGVRGIYEVTLENKKPKYKKVY